MATTLSSLSCFSPPLWRIWVAKRICRQNMAMVAAREYPPLSSSSFRNFRSSWSSEPHWQIFKVLSRAAPRYIFFSLSPRYVEEKSSKSNLWGVENSTVPSVWIHHMLISWSWEISVGTVPLRICDVRVETTDDWRANGGRWGRVPIQSQGRSTGFIEPFWANSKV